MKQLRPPLVTCEAVLTEAAYFLRDDGVDIDPLFRMLERAALNIDFDMSANWPRMRTLMRRYEEPIRHLGSFKVPVRVGPKIVPTVNVTVEPE